MKTKTPKPPRVFSPLPPGAVILSLDVSSSASGWCVGRILDDGKLDIVDFGVAKPPSSWDSMRRADFMGMKLACMLKKHDVSLVVMEHQSHCSSGKRIQGLAVLGQAQGAIRAILAITHRVETTTEREWTRIDGRNRKKEVRAEYIKKAVPAYAAAVEANPKLDRGLDACDAIGIILWRVSQ